MPVHPRVPEPVGNEKSWTTEVRGIDDDRPRVDVICIRTFPDGSFAEHIAEETIDSITSIERDHIARDEQTVRDPYSPAEIDAGLSLVGKEGSTLCA